MTNYQNGKIYKIEAHNGEEGDIYIGSTCNQFLNERFRQHSNNFNSWKQEKSKYRTTSFQLFEKYGIENCFITLVEIFPCNLKNELLVREVFYIRSMKCVNKYIPLRSVYERKKVWRENNQEIYKESTKQYYKKRSIRFICQCGKEVMECNRLRHCTTKLHNDMMSLIK
jgi:hypothetical protein